MRNMISEGIDHILLHKHPEVYLIIIPGFGIISHVISAFSEKQVFG